MAAAAVSVIESDAFLATVPPSQDNLHTHHIAGVAEIPDFLKDKGYVDEGDANLWVTTVIRTDTEGVATQIFLSVHKAHKTLKFKARKLFPDSPENAMIRLASLDLHAFEFPPSSNASNWVASKDLQFSVMKSNNRDHGSYTMEEFPDIKVKECCFRLVVSPTEDVCQAMVSLVCLPVPMEEKNSLPGSPTGLCPGYPVVEAFRFSSCFNSGIPSPTRQDGFPFLPLLISAASPPPIPDVPSIKKAMYTFWSSMMQPNMMSISMWSEETAGPAAPSTDQARTAFAWPSYQAEAAESDTETEYGDDEDADHTYQEIRARRLAAEIARTHGSGIPPDNSGNGVDGGGVSAPGAGATGGSGKNGPKTPAKKDQPDKRKRRSKSQSIVDTDSGSDREKSSSKKRMKPSAILNKEDWPPGYTRAQIDEMGVEAALKLSERLEKKKKKQNEGLPGTKVSSTDVKIATVTVKSGKDNADDVIHPQRFSASLVPILAA